MNNDNFFYFFFIKFTDFSVIIYLIYFEGLLHTFCFVSLSHMQHIYQLGFRKSNFIFFALIFEWNFWSNIKLKYEHLGQQFSTFLQSWTTDDWLSRTTDHFGLCFKNTLIKTEFFLYNMEICNTYREHLEFYLLNYLYYFI